MAAFDYLQTFGKGGAATWKGLFENRVDRNGVQRTSQDGAHGVSGELEPRIDVIGRINAELARIEAADPDLASVGWVLAPMPNPPTHPPPTLF